MEDFSEGASHSNWNERDTSKVSDLPMGLYASGYGGNYSNKIKGPLEQNKDLNTHNKISCGQSIHKTKNSKKKYGIGLKYLEILSSKKSHDIIVELISQKLEFYELLKNDELSADYIVIILNILCNICDSNVVEIKFDILSSSQNVFLYSLHNCINSLYKESESFHSQSGISWANLKSFWNNLYIYLKCMTKLISIEHSEILVKIIASTRTCITNMEKCKLLNQLNGMCEKFQYLENEFMSHSQDLHIHALDRMTHTRNQIYPTAEDFNNCGENLQPLLKSGAYSNIKSYLEIQTTLMKEDFLAPFRKAISDCKIGNKNMLKSECRIYEEVVFVEETLIKNKLCLVIRIINRKTDNKNLPHAYFMYGSLLCLSNDNFSTLLFATVIDGRDLSSGYLVVRLCELYDIHGMFSCTYFQMLESEVYFEPYFHVLTALNQFNEDNFPMSNYFINAETRTKFPEYALDVLNFKYKGKELSILNTEDWPSPNDIGLNSSQLEAIKGALTSDLVLIQGPPGTGKTFIGREVASILINNIKRPRMLVVCYTNQALDKFLVALTSITKNIIRIGNQSAEPSLSKYHISTKQCARSSSLTKALLQIESEILLILKCIKINQCTLKILNSNKGIICMKDNKFATELKIAKWLPSSSTLLSAFSNWLLGTKNDNILEQLGHIKSYDISSENQIEKNQEIDSDPECLRSFEILEDFAFTTNDDFNAIPKENFDITIDDLQKSLGKLDEQMKRSEQQVNSEEYLNELKQEKEELEFWMHHLIMRLSSESSLSRKVAPVSNGNLLNFEERWSLYWQWLELLKNSYIEKSRKLNFKYDSLSKQYEEIKFIQYINILKDTEVIGMTTTSAARLQIVLKELKIPIIILEEAAEIPEAHAVTSLTDSCQHLIMIGDYKQLQPKNAVYELAENYNLKISLFERLLNNGVQCHTLNEQYRMRPEIASLLTPTIYESLLNNISVIKYPSIRGLTKNLFFIKHNYFEETNANSTSHSNKHEARFIVKLCQYLLMNKYEASDIIILTTYSEQMVVIVREMEKISILKKVKVAVVDNYQGQENRIVLLSLVRSNKECNIGFLNKQNRICVALSRAKEGLFIIGNMDNLSTRCEIWRELEKVLISQNAIGCHIVLEFQHKGRIIQFKVATDEDFEQPIRLLL